jgi:hypothetical protein
VTGLERVVVVLEVLNESGNGLRRDGAVEFDADR